MTVKEYSSPLIEELINETTPEELERINQEMQNKVDIEDWERLRYRIDEEGMEYCFRQYSHWEEINDEKFHELRLKLINVMEEIREYVDKQIENYNNETNGGNK